MKYTVKDVDIATGGIQVVILNQRDARKMDLHHMDRLLIKYKGRKTVGVLDLAESKKAIPPGSIGLMEEVLDALNVKGGATVDIEVASKPESFEYIKKKLDGKELLPEELTSIVEDIVYDRLTQIELTSFVTANYTRGMSREEIIHLTLSMAKSGECINCVGKGPVVDIHSIGGIPGNRTTMLVVPILAAKGVMFPKTASRAITSPAGTADTMEVLCPVTFDIKALKKLMTKTKAFIIWGGGVGLSPADDKIIRIENPLGIDPEGQMIASIMSKKASVGSTHLLLEIPSGKESKIKTPEDAVHLSRMFQDVSNDLHIKTRIMVTDGCQPVGNGVGPVLEARDVMWVLENDKRAPQDLLEKSLEQAGALLEFIGMSKNNQGYYDAKKILETGQALNAMQKIVKAQGGKIPQQFKLAKYAHKFSAPYSGTILDISNKAIAKICRIAGAPKDPKAGMYIEKHKHARVNKGDILFTIYSDNEEELKFAIEIAKKMNPYLIG